MSNPMVGWDLNGGDIVLMWGSFYCYEFATFEQVRSLARAIRYRGYEAHSNGGYISFRNIPLDRFKESLKAAKIEFNELLAATVWGQFTGDGYRIVQPTAFPEANSTHAAHSGPRRQLSDTLK